MLGNPFQKLIEAQLGGLQANLQQAAQELECETVEASVGGGVVRVKMTGSGQLVELKIDPAIVTGDDVELLEDLLVAALRECQARANQLRRDKIMSATPLGAMGVDLPGIL